MTFKLCISVLLIVLSVVVVHAMLRQGPWQRAAPLAHPIAVRSVYNGVLVLADGRRLKPAGVQRRDEISTEEYDAFLHAATAQGVEIIRSVDSSSALLCAEPKFWNWCGTSNQRWPGSYIRWPLAELLIISNYANPDPDAHATMAEDERDRLASAVRFRGPPDSLEPWRVSRDTTQIIYSSTARIGPELDSHLKHFEDAESD